MKARELTTDETAALWRVRLSDAQAPQSERAEFERWLTAAAENSQAYRAMEHAWDASGEEAGDPDIRAMREAALRFQAPVDRPWWRSSAIAAVAASIVAAVAGLWLVLDESPLDRPESAFTHAVTHGQFQTALGERATVHLGDGSIVTLNTASRVQVDLAGANREVRLLSGQAIFEVARDKSRPFVVLAGDRKITALGTAFDVRLEKREVRVTLVEGKVAVDRLPEAVASRETPSVAMPSMPSTHLEPGEQLVAALGGVATVQSTDVGRVTSWREGRLIFEGDHLSGALEEMNRYAETPIVLGDPSIGDLRLSGVFRTGQPAAFAHALEQYFPLESGQQGGAIVLRWKK